jgi:U3 small nucleolar RNA-associated protein 3
MPRERNLRVMRIHSNLGVLIIVSHFLTYRDVKLIVDIFQRDQIMFNPQDESDGDDDFTQDGEEVLSLNLRKNRDEDVEEDYEDVEEEEEEDEEMPTLSKKEKAKAKAKNDLLTKGRFGKPIVSSDEEDEASGSGSGSGSSDEEEEGWGRSYYSRPSSRKEKEDLRGEYDEKKEEEREMEIKEVKRLQRKAREGLADDDWGLVDDVEEPEPYVPSNHRCLS